MSNPLTFKLIAGSSNPDFVRLLSDRLGIVPINSEMSKFPDGEIGFDINESVRGKHVYIVYSKGSNVNEELMEIYLIAKTLKASSAKRVTLVMPYMPYSRQDKRNKGREPISSKYIMDMLDSSGIDNTISVDLHNPSIQAFSSKPHDNLTAVPLFINYIKKTLLKDSHDDVMVVSPDAGGVKRAKKLSEALGVPLAICYKERKKASEISDMKLLGSVDGMRCILIDDMTDTCGTLMKSCSLIKENGATEVHAFVTHGILSGPAIERIDTGAIDSLIVTNTVDVHDKALKSKKIKVINIAPMIAEAIRRNFANESTAPLFSHTHPHRIETI